MWGYAAVGSVAGGFDPARSETPDEDQERYEDNSRTQDTSNNLSGQVEATMPLIAWGVS